MRSTRCAEAGAATTKATAAALADKNALRNFILPLPEIPTLLSVTMKRIHWGGKTPIGSRPRGAPGRLFDALGPFGPAPGEEGFDGGEEDLRLLDMHEMAGPGHDQPPRLAIVRGPVGDSAERDGVAFAGDHQHRDGDGPNRRPEVVIRQRLPDHLVHTLLAPHRIERAGAQVSAEPRLALHVMTIELENGAREVVADRHRIFRPQPDF